MKGSKFLMIIAFVVCCFFNCEGITGRRPAMILFNFLQYTSFEIKRCMSLDTSLFGLVQIRESKLLSFNSKNTISLKAQGIQMEMKEIPGDSYILTIRKAGKLIMSRRNIKGISQVYVGRNYLLFSIFNYVDEDGNNEGTAFAIDLKTNKVQEFLSKLKNTCNPIFVNDNFYLINDLNLLCLSHDMKIKNKVEILYSSKIKENNMMYVDRYAICSLSEGTYNKIIINFTPNRTSACKSYTGILNEKSKKILLR